MQRQRKRSSELSADSSQRKASRVHPDLKACLTSCWNQWKQSISLGTVDFIRLWIKLIVVYATISTSVATLCLVLCTTSCVFAAFACYVFFPQTVKTIRQPNCSCDTHRAAISMDPDKDIWVFLRTHCNQLWVVQQCSDLLVLRGFRILSPFFLLSFCLYR